MTTVHIGNVIRNATTFNAHNWTGEMMNPDSLIESVAKLFVLLEQRKADYVLVGGIALLTYVEGRNTEDIDVIMAIETLEKLPEIKIENKDMYFASGHFENLKIDVLLTKNPLFDKVRSKFTATQQFLERNIPTATVEGLLLLKLFALPSLYRQGNFARVGIYENDIATLMYQFKPDMEMLFAELGKHLNDTDMASLREIVVEIEQRITRFRKNIE